MAKRKGKRSRKGRVPAHLRRYLFKSKKSKGRRKGRSTMAKKRRRKSTRRASPRRTHHRKARRRGGRRGGGGGGYALMPGREDMKRWAACAAIGFVESKAKTDDSFIANKLPTPVQQIGFLGNLALVLWVGSHFFKNPWIRLGAREAAGITAYQIGRMGKPFASGKDKFSISGWTDDDVAMAIEQNMGALRATGDGDGMMPGVSPYGDLAEYGEYDGMFR